ncbi:O-antigen biosynthesis glycosyltransferase [Bordetella trematum]|uniref:glycosyltransferase family 4 protein n=1 Tax=Bordetella trematum TaxID=123899 RepID=UPI0004702805|nr:glycosyltransferase family 4 protein [Bordetella trematum]AUL46070.1 glycosyl transferase [Bordetella trematum]QIM71438.1 glycosyltransferase family 4 protein [Bordetella trematum]SAI47147.1 O-antigen biosynthesis glycosyltransferase [Bordetella trematum]
MKIVLAVSSMQAGGAERVAATLANAWSARGDHVTLLPTFSGGGTCFYPLSDEVELLWLADEVPARGLWGAFKRLLGLRRLIRERRPDVVVSFLTNVNVAAILATRGLGVPLIVCERTNPAVETNTSQVWRRLRRWLYPRAEIVTVQAEATVAPFAAQVPGLKDLAVIPNPLPPELLDAPHAPLAPDAQGRRRLCAMGRLVPDKQFDLLIDVFADLAARHPDWDLWIWGEGPQREALQARIDGLGLASRVSLPGRTDAPWEALSQASAFVLCSAVEGFPNVLLEAMSLGLPCVAFDCPSGPREMSRGGQDALLVPAADRQALGESLERVMGDAALRASLGAQGAASVRRRYALPAVLAEWDTLIARAQRKR